MRNSKLAASVADEGMPLYRQVFADLRQRIAVGEYEVGDTLPSEDSLSAHYGVSKITTRRALQELSLEGLIERRQGIGTIVRRLTTQFTFEGDVESLLENFAFQSLNHHSEILEFRRNIFAEEICDLMELPPGTIGLTIASIAIRDGQRVYYSSTSVADTFSLELNRVMLRNTAAIIILMQKGVQIGSADQRLSATSPPSFVQTALEVQKNHPMLRARLTIFDHTGSAIEHVDSYIRGDVFEYRSIMTRTRK
jgi:DNA-binding GntR family transcriptional regulator